ncbi:MAG TPA: hypothetical protein VGB76_14245 [Pyrinomonadaceae bacterium]
MRTPRQPAPATLDPRSIQTAAQLPLNLFVLRIVSSYLAGDASYKFFRRTTPLDEAATLSCSGGHARASDLRPAVLGGVRRGGCGSDF